MGRILCHGINCAQKYRDFSRFLVIKITFNHCSQIIYLKRTNILYYFLKKNLFNTVRVVAIDGKIEKREREREREYTDFPAHFFEVKSKWIDNILKIFYLS